MKSLLVTGGLGFIGSNFIKDFLNSRPEWTVINFDKQTYCGNPENLRELEASPRYQYFKGDICRADEVRQAVEKAEAVIHFAAETHVDRSIDNPEDFLHTNVIGTRNLLEAAKRARIRRFVHISTDEVYGSLPEGVAEEEAPLRPNSPYSASKAAGDLLARSYWKTYQFPVIICRSTNNFGPYQFPEKVIPLFVTNLLENKKVPLYGAGQNRRDWIYVEDNCRAIEIVFDQGQEGDIYNIGAGNEMSNIDLTHKILRAMNCSTRSAIARRIGRAPITGS